MQGWLHTPKFIQKKLTTRAWKPQYKTYNNKLLYRVECIFLLLEDKFQGANMPDLNLHLKSGKKSGRWMRKTLGTTEILTGTNQSLNKYHECLRIRNLPRINSEENMVVRRAQQAQLSYPFFSFCLHVKYFWLIKANICFPVGTKCKWNRLFT